MNDDSPDEAAGFSEPDTPNPYLDGLLTQSRETALAAENAHLRQVLWDILLATGFDCDGDRRVPPPGVYTPDIPKLAMQAVKELRADHDQACRLIPDPGEVVVSRKSLADAFRAAPVTDALAMLLGGRTAKEMADEIMEALTGEAS